MKIGVADVVVKIFATFMPKLALFEAILVFYETVMG